MFGLSGKSLEDKGGADTAPPSCRRALPPRWHCVAPLLRSYGYVKGRRRGAMEPWRQPALIGLYLSSAAILLDIVSLLLRLSSDGGRRLQIDVNLPPDGEVEIHVRSIGSYTKSHSM